MSILATALSLASFAPDIIGLFTKDKGKSELVERVVNAAKNITGTEDEKQALEKISNDPKLALEFQKAVMEDSHVETRLENEHLKVINKTLQAESKSEKWWVSGWRPFIGFIVGISFIVCIGYIGYLIHAAIDSGDNELLSIMPSIVFNLATLFGIPGSILGIASHHRGRMQRGIK